MQEFYSFCRRRYKNSKGVLGLKLEDISFFSDLPEWVQHRLLMAADNIGSSSFDFYVESLTIHPTNYSRHAGVAYFLTEKEFIKVDLKVESITCEKIKLSSIINVVHHISVPLADSFTSNDVKVQLTSLVFMNADSITIDPPKFDLAENIKLYKQLVNKL